MATGSASAVTGGTGSVSGITSVGGTVAETTAPFIVYPSDLGNGRFNFGADDGGLRFLDGGSGIATLSTSAGTYVGMALNERVSLRTY